MKKEHSHVEHNNLNEMDGQAGCLVLSVFHIYQYSEEPAHHGSHSQTQYGSQTTKQGGCRVQRHLQQPHQSYGLPISDCLPQNIVVCQVLVWFVHTTHESIVLLNGNRPWYFYGCSLAICTDTIPRYHGRADYNGRPSAVCRVKRSCVRSIVALVGHCVRSV